MSDFTHSVWGVRGLHALTLEEESDRSQRLALALAERRHELLELGAALDLEKDLVVVIRDLDVKVLDGGGGAIGASVSTSVLSVVRHVDDLELEILGRSLVAKKFRQ